jgi:pSer/pThr/pTyr-binding forkhead associated (FHA) protein
MRLIVQQGRAERVGPAEASGAGQALRLERGLLTIGRSQDCDLVLQDTQASRHHAELRRYGDQWLIVDLGSTNGTMVGGMRLPPGEARPLPPGIPVRIGDTQFVLEEEPPSPPLPSWEGDRPPAVAPVASPPVPFGSGGGAGVWLARGLVAAGGLSLIVGSLLPWIRVEVSLPLVGRVLDQVYDGLDSGQAGLFIGVAVMALLLVVVDVVVRRKRSELAVGLGQALAGAVAVVSVVASVYRYYQVGTMEFLGVSLADILTNYLSNQVHISMQFGVYLVAAGLVGLILGGLLRLLVAARESA